MPETVNPELVQPEAETSRKSKPRGNGTTASESVSPQATDDTALIPRGDVDMLMVEAVRSGNVEVMAQVMEIRRELKAEAAREAFFDSFAEFQAECPIIRKTKWVLSDSGNKLYSYAPLDSIIKQVGDLIGKHGFSYTIKPSFEEPTDRDPMGRVSAIVRVQHVAGHVEESPFSISVKEATRFTNSAQQAGTALTYAKRYAFCAAFGISTEDEDTDGVSPIETISKPQTKELRKLFDQLSEPRKVKALAYLGVEEIEFLPVKKYNHAILTLTKALSSEGETVSRDQEATLTALLEELGDKHRQDFLAVNQIQRVADLLASRYQTALKSLQEKRRG